MTLCEKCGLEGSMGHTITPTKVHEARMLRIAALEQQVRSLGGNPDGPTIYQDEPTRHPLGGWAIVHDTSTWVVPDEKPQRKVIPPGSRPPPPPSFPGVNIVFGGPASVECECGEFHMVAPSQVKPHHITLEGRLKRRPDCKGATAQ